jgi:hypothetical protein
MLCGAQKIEILKAQTERKNQSVKPLVSRAEPNKKTLQQQPKKRGEKQNRQRRTKGDKKAD